MRETLERHRAARGEVCHRGIGFLAALAGAWALVGTTVRAQFTNGGFEDGNLGGWTVEYGNVLYSGGCGPPKDWVSGNFAPAGHPKAALITAGTVISNQDLDVDPYEGSYMLKINDYGGNRHATRVSQAAPLPSSLLLRHLNVEWGAMLTYPQGHSSACQPFFSIEVSVNGNVVESFVATGNDAGAANSGWEKANAFSLWYRRGVFCTNLTSYDAGDSVLVRMTVADCGLGAHGGYAFLDDVRFQFACGGECTPAPEGLTGWWPLDEPAETTQRAMDLARGNSGSRQGPLVSDGQYVAGSLTFDGVSTRVVVPDPVDEALDVGPVVPPMMPDDGAFSVDAWIRPDHLAGRQTIVNKVDCQGVFDPDCPQRGYTFFLEDNRLGVKLIPHQSTAETFYSDPLPGLLDDDWHLVAVAVDRQMPGGVRFYVDGGLVAPFGESAIHISSSLANSSQFQIGAAGYIDHFAGEIDEVEFFKRAVTQSEFQAIYDMGPQGKCKALMSIPECLNYCWNETTISVPVRVTNLSPVDQDYLIEISGSPAGGACDVDGPSSFSHLGGLSLVPGESGVEYVGVPRPSGLVVPGQKACYRVRVWNFNGLTFERRGTLGLLPPGPCFKPAAWTDAIGVGLSAQLAFEDTGGPGGGEFVSYSVQSVSSGGGVSALSLNQHAPGLAVNGQVSGDSSGVVSVQIEAAQHHPETAQEVRLYVDGDRDGTEELHASITLGTAPGAPGTVMAAEFIRPGEPANPVALWPAASSDPVLGTTWDPHVDHTEFLPSALIDILVFSLGAVDLDLGFHGTLLCSLPFLAVEVQFSAGAPFAISLPNDPVLAGLGLCVQGGSDDGGGLRLTNALDVTLGLQ